MSAPGRRHGSGEILQGCGPAPRTIDEWQTTALSKQGPSRHRHTSADASDHQESVRWSMQEGALVGIQSKAVAIALSYGASNRRSDESVDHNPRPTRRDVLNRELPPHAMIRGHPPPPTSRRTAGNPWFPSDEVRSRTHGRNDRRSGHRSFGRSGGRSSDSLLALFANWQQAGERNILLQSHPRLHRTHGS